MKKGIYVFLVSIMLGLSSCASATEKEYNFEGFTALQNVNLNDYETDYEGADFEILKRKESAVDSSLVFAMYGIILKNDSTGDACTIGVQTEYMYIVQYNENVYDLSDAYYIGLYDCNLLVDLDIIK